MAWNVLIAGGGFGGFYAAKTLAKVLPPHSARVRLVTEDNFMLYTPLLPGAAAGTLEPRHVVVPLREELDSSIHLRLAKITGATPHRNVIHVRSLDGTQEELRYDQLIVALGSVSRTLPIPGLAEHGKALKSLPEAIALRNHVVRTLEIAETLEDGDARREYLTYIFVGAGYAGLEGLAELQDFAADVIDLYPRCQVTGMRWILVEASGRVMPEIGQKLADFAVRELRARGIEIRTQTTLDEVTARSARLSDGEVVATRTLVWTAGVKPHPVVAQLGLPLDDRGRIDTDDRLQVKGFDNVWAIGDCAAVPDPARKGVPSPPTAQHAIRQGRVVGRNVANALGGGGRGRRFTYKTKGVFVDMGRRKAVATTGPITWSGTPAWLLARSYHLAMMPGAGRRARLLVDWNIGLLFGRDTAELGRLGEPRALEAPLAEVASAGANGTEDDASAGAPAGSASAAR
ncbi:MAG: NADH dehydrogenase [uncultured Solirubrobacteraceae bacterium]|uniref:NADH dehydrogenase n=1 Tax=uncultured Solirubrobacteraceae bacterium TaxID=1162706 RepID=A0A6J4SQY6_9ACTN|nr:MAG: NADH dehydrogenase [uncultured Solirubrobacteraceae bacterium]